MKEHLLQNTIKVDKRNRLLATSLNRHNGLLITDVIKTKYTSDVSKENSSASSNRVTLYVYHQGGDHQ